MSALYFSQAVAAHNDRIEVYRSLGLDCIPEPIAPVHAPAPVIPPRPYAGSYAVALDRRRRPVTEML